MALRLYATTDLDNATVTGDALNNNIPQARAVLERSGDYFFQLKNENRHAHKAAVQRTATTPPFTHVEEPDTDYGRLDQRRITVYPFEPLFGICLSFQVMDAMSLTSQARKSQNSKVCSDIHEQCSDFLFRDENPLR